MPQAISSPAHHPRCPGLTLWDQHVGQDAETSQGLEAGQSHAAAEEPEQEDSGDPGHDVHGSEEDLEEEDVTPQVLQVKDQPVVGGHQEEAAGQSQSWALAPQGRGGPVALPHTWAVPEGAASPQLATVMP